MAYAKDTEVPFERSISEIVGLLRNAGADAIGQMEDRTTFQIQFAMHDRQVRFRVRFPTVEEAAKLAGPRQDPARVATQWRRERGRALLLVIKAKLESVESEVETFEQSFLANIVLADGATVYERAQEPIALEYRTGKVAPLMLPGPRL